MTIHLAADHAGFELKRVLIDSLEQAGHEVVDHGAAAYDADDDYPDFITPCAEAVGSATDVMGIVIGGSGHGEAMAANRVPGVRAASFYGPRGGDDGYDIVRVSRMHNNANILSLGARFITEEEALEAVRIFLNTPFSEDARHVRRIAKF